MPKTDVCLRDRFWKKVQKSPDGCWLWVGEWSRSSRRYGSFNWEGAPMQAHRSAWILERGLIPEGMNVLHRCDIPRCVRPDHLFLGTQADNVHDCMAKKRAAIGSRLGRAKLNEETVLAIRREYAFGLERLTAKALARKWGVGKTNITPILRGWSWKHVPAFPVLTTPSGRLVSRRDHSSYCRKEERQSMVIA